MDQSDAVSQHVERAIVLSPGPFELLEAEMAAFELGVDPVIAASTCTAVQNDLDAAKEWLYPSRALIRDAESTCPGIVEAAAILAKAVNNSEKVAIFGDYDVDGVSGAAILELGLEKLGISCLVDHPSASEGFGLTDRFIAEAVDQGYSILCVVDCGSDQAEVIAVAQSRGLKVIVCDHHGADPENPADAHINPNLHSPPPTAHTGSPLAWKLLVELDKQLRHPLDDWLFETPLFLVGMGLMADRASVLIPEHRALLRLARDHAPAGVLALAANFDEDPALPGGLVRTRAVLNLGKRTSRVRASSARRVLTAQRAEDAEQAISELLSEYEAATVFRENMTEQALSQVDSPDVSEQPLGIAVLDERFSEYSGYSGVVAGAVAGKCSKSTIVFVPVVDSYPPHLKFSGRPGGRTTKTKKKLGVLHRQLDKDEPKNGRDAKARNALGAVVIAIGGHEEVVAGTVEVGKLCEAIGVLRAWWRPTKEEDKRDSAVYVAARKVTADRWRELEMQCQRLAPFTDDCQPVAHGVSGSSKNREPRISVLAKVTFPEQPTEDPDRPGWLIATMRDDGGSERDARFPVDVQPPPDGDREWVITVQPSPEVVFLRWSSAAE